MAEQLCDRILIIRHGSLVFTGTLEELRKEYPDRSLEEIFLKINGELSEEEAKGPMESMESKADTAAGEETPE